MIAQARDQPLTSKLYDLEADPFEMRNLIGLLEDRSYLHDRLLEWMNDTRPFGDIERRPCTPTSARHRNYQHDRQRGETDYEPRQQDQMTGLREMTPSREGKTRSFNHRQGNASPADAKAVKSK
jgi:hypothetical protein